MSLVLGVCGDPSGITLAADRGPQLTEPEVGSLGACGTGLWGTNDGALEQFHTGTKTNSYAEGKLHSLNCPYPLSFAHWPSLRHFCPTAGLSIYPPRCYKSRQKCNKGQINAKIEVRCTFSVVTCTNLNDKPHECSCGHLGGWMRRVYQRHGILVPKLKKA